MRRPFFWPGISLACGILLGKFFSFPSSLVLLFLVFSLPFLWFFRGRKLFRPVFLLTLISIGILRIENASKVSTHNVSNFVQADWISLEGKIISLPELKEKGRRKIYSFVLEAKRLIRRNEFFEIEGKVQIFLFNPKEAPAYGTQTLLRGKLSKPSPARNPGEFDYQKYLSDQGIYSVFQGYGSHSLRVIENKSNFSFSPLGMIQKTRDACSHQFDSIFSFPVNVFLQALVLGIRKGLPEGFRDDFIKTGTTHLIAISGMNITLVAGTLFFLSLCLGFPQKVAALVGLFSTVSYVFLSGAGIPVVRAGWMSGLFFTGLLLEREKDLMNSLFFALFAILAADPKAIFQVGFQLSFLSVFSLIMLTPRRLSGWYSEGFQTMTVVVGTFPLCVIYFSVFSWVSLFTNLLAIPLFNLASIGGLGSLLGANIPVIGPLITWATSLSLKAGLFWIQFWAKQPWGYNYLKQPSLGLCIFYYGTLGFVWLAQKFKTRLYPLFRIFSIATWLTAAILFFLPFKKGNFALTILAVGQNELLHIECPRHRHWLVNTGRGAPSNQAMWTLSPFLRRNGIKNLQGIILTDFSHRHTGGLPNLLENFSINVLLFPVHSRIPRDLNRQITKVAVASGDQVPIEDQTGFRVLDLIDGQLVLLIYHQNQKFLLIPSWKSKVLKRALLRAKDFSPIDVLILPALTQPAEIQWEEIISSLSPHWIVFSKRTREVEPTLESLKEKEIPFYFLSETGALRFEERAGNLSITPYT